MIMNIPRELIYEDKLSLDDFQIDLEGSIDCDFYDLLQRVDLERRWGEDLEKTYLNTFNDAYYIATSVLLDKRPELKFDDYKRVANEEIISPNTSIFSEDSVRGRCVLSMVYALLNELDIADKSIQRFMEKLHTWINSNEEAQWMLQSIINLPNPFVISEKPNLAPRNITPSLLVGVEWSNVIVLFNKQGEFQKAQVNLLVNTLGKTVNEKIYIIDAISKYIEELEANELPF